MLVFDFANGAISMYRNGVAYGNPYSTGVIAFPDSFVKNKKTKKQKKNKKKTKKKTADIV